MEAVETTVSAGIAFTYNLGDYNNIRIEMKIDNVAPRKDESVSEALDRAYSLLDRKIEEKLQKAVAEFRG